MKETFYLDLRQVSDEESFHNVASQALCFPYYYGRNKDAFWDCITDIVENSDVEIIGYDQLNPTVQIALQDYMDMLKDYEQQSDGRFTIKFSR